jgi:CheY-like chemotaxis protein
MDKRQRQKTILLVEDDPDHAELALLALEKHGFAQGVVVARDGAEALDYLLREDLPNFVLLDLKLPKISGLEVLRCIREDERTRLLPVIVLSSSDEEKDILRTYELGVNSYILKPTDFSEFTEAARQVGVYWLTLTQVPRNKSA